MSISDRKDVVAIVCGLTPFSTMAMCLSYETKHTHSRTLKLIIGERPTALMIMMLSAATKSLINSLTSDAYLEIKRFDLRESWKKADNSFLEDNARFFRHLTLEIGLFDGVIGLITTITSKLSSKLKGK